VYDGGNKSSLYSTLRSTGLGLFIFPSISMSDSSPTDYGAELAGGVFEVASQFINQKIVEAIRKNFSGDGKKQRGDFYMDQSRELLQMHFQEIQRKDKQHILRMFTRLDQIAWAWHSLRCDATGSGMYS
jgi:hypothetical protein